MVLFERKDGFVRLLGTILVFLVFFGGAPNEAPVADAAQINDAVSYTHLRAHETRHDLVCRLLLEKK